MLRVWPVVDLAQWCLQGPQCAFNLLQDYEIECPDTKTKFSLKTGEITDWWAPPLHVCFRLHAFSMQCPGYVGVQAAHCGQDSLAMADAT